MATRATIKLEGYTVAKLYKHWDGYPEATFPWLEKFNKEFTEKRGDDPFYKFAQLIRSSVIMADEFNLDTSTETGWGVFNYNDEAGEDYEYTLMKNGNVEVLSV